jgi:hypothetical protein
MDRTKVPSRAPFCHPFQRSGSIHDAHSTTERPTERSADSPKRRHALGFTIPIRQVAGFSPGFKIPVAYVPCVARWGIADERWTRNGVCSSPMVLWEQARCALSCRFSLCVQWLQCQSSNGYARYELPSSELPPCKLRRS